MRELGANAVLYHEEIGREAKRLGIDHLYAYGKLTEFTVKAFGEQGFHFEDQHGLIDALRSQLGPNVTVLVKGSLSTGMKKVVAALIE
jgi:UDP-N-acetylmuramoyl-tripeptide--D-alanyl-D-alanine ligase